MTENSSTTYSQAGVSIDTGNQLIEQIKPVVATTKRRESLSALGGFAALTPIPDTYQQPILVTATDGVGTKLKLATEQKSLSTIGIDLVAMCVNDIVCTGAEPLSFLDYYATAKLDITEARQVITGIAEGCRLAGCELSGGETAEMPGMYQPGDFDLAGFCSGIAEKHRLFKPEDIKDSDLLIALSSSGPHANGYSLIRYMLREHNIDLKQMLTNKTLAEHLLMPTHIYVKPILAAREQFNIKGIAHITGGGITENLPRCLPDKLDAYIKLSSWQTPAVFQWLQQLGKIDETEMLRTFNCGVGMILVVDESHSQSIIHFFNQQQLDWKAWQIGCLSKAQSIHNKVNFVGKFFTC